MSSQSRNNIVVIGSKGMLGSMVESYFALKNINVVTVDERITRKNIKRYIEILNFMEPAIIINCIGKIKQKTDNASELFFLNAQLPIELLRFLDNKHLLVHPSTDCVYSGNLKGAYENGCPHDAVDLYGISKSLGEKSLSARKNTIIVRTSIIGINKRPDSGLLAWFLSNSDGAEVPGFADHFWNGITTLQWCKSIDQIIDRYLECKDQSSLTVQLGCDRPINKYDLLQLFNKTFKRNIGINRVNSGFLSRVLLSNISVPDIEYQLQDLRNYFDR